MSDAPNLYRALERDWERQSSEPAGATALRRWSHRHGELEGIRSLADVVASARTVGERGRGVLRAVLAEAGGDPWAARTALQTVLPGLGAVARRARTYVGGAAPVWQSGRELDQHVMCVAYERIVAGSHRGAAFPARSLVDATWQRVRQHALGVRGEAARHVTISDEAVDVVAGPERSGAEELALALADAVAGGVVKVGDAGVVYCCRVRGERVEEVAARLGRDPSVLWKRRRRAEAALARHLCGAAAPGDG